MRYYVVHNNDNVQHNQTIVDDDKDFLLCNSIM